MKDRNHKRRQRRDSRCGTHDVQPQLFSITVTDADIEISHRFTREGLQETLIKARKRQGNYSRDSLVSKRKSKERKKSVQYKLHMRTRDKARVVEYVPKPACSRYSDARQRGNDLVFTPDDIILVHKKMLYAFQEAFQQNWATTNARCIELVVWMTANRPNDPFSFETCCWINNVDPDMVRDAILRQVRKRYEHERLHYDVFRQSVMAAERGDPDALNWIRSEEDSEFSFLGLCRIFDFDPKTARSQIRVPAERETQAA